MRVNEKMGLNFHISISEKGEHVKKVEGTYCCYDGLIVTQLSVWDIVNNSEDVQIKRLLKRISKRSKHPNTVKVTFSVETENEQGKENA